MSPHVESWVRLVQILKIRKKRSASLADLSGIVSRTVVHHKDFKGFPSMGLPPQRKERPLQMTSSIAGGYDDGKKHQSKPGPIKVGYSSFPLDQRAKVFADNSLNPLGPSQIVQNDASPGFYKRQPVDDISMTAFIGMISINEDQINSLSERPGNIQGSASMRFDHMPILPCVALKMLPRVP
jgi:hypothetical protein